MTAPELKPCPFCGRAIEITDDLRHYNHPMSACFGRHIGIAASDIDRIEMWNRRADLAAVQPAQVRPETTSEHIARDMREGRFPERSEPQMVADPAAVQPAHVHPDPRDEVIARLVDALRLMRSTYPYNPPCYGWVEQVEAHKTAKAALAAAKAVQHG